MPQSVLILGSSAYSVEEAPETQTGWRSPVISPYCVEEKSVLISLSANECHRPGLALARTLLTLSYRLFHRVLRQQVSRHLPQNLTINLYEQVHWPAVNQKQPGQIYRPRTDVGVHSGPWSGTSFQRKEMLIKEVVAERTEFSHESF